MEGKKSQRPNLLNAQIRTNTTSLNVTNSFGFGFVCSLNSESLTINHVHSHSSKFSGAAGLDTAFWAQQSFSLEEGSLLWVYSSLCKSDHSRCSAFNLNWAAAFVHPSIQAWCDTERSCRLADHPIMHKNTFSVSLLPQHAWQPWQLLWLEPGRAVTHSGSAGATNSRSLTGKSSCILWNYPLWNSMPGKKGSLKEDLLL